LSLNAQAYTYYQKKDALNNTVFSDQPSADAKIVLLKPINIYLPQQTATTSETITEKNKITYTEFSIIHPSPQQTFQNQTDIPVKLNIIPNLEKDSKILLLLDGKALPTITTDNTVLQQLDRGAHQLQAKLLNQLNEELMTTDIINFYVHYPIVNAKY